MSFFEDASLVLIPSAQKTSKVYSVKPTDGTGDLTFTRSNDTATRVGPDGLIEKVRTNLILQSETFDNASWTKSNATITANSIANPVNGATTAETLTFTGAAAAKYLLQSNTISGSYSQSVYFKYSTHQWMQLFQSGDGAFSANFDIQNGVLGSYNGCTPSIVSVGSGWYRCTITFASTTATQFVIWAIDSGTDARATNSASTGSVYIFGAQMEVSDFGATPYIATTSAAVSVGPVANVPRLDYLNSSCPRLLLEPQRTNLFQYSEQLNNAYWTLTGGTITANTTETTDPSGYNGADKFVCGSGGGIGIYTPIITTTTTPTFSVFAKKGTSSTLQLVQFSNRIALFNLDAGTVTSATNGTAKIEDYGNGWYRCSFTTNLSGAYRFYIDVIGANAEYAYVFGAQLEDATYATSYIPTLGAAVTRGADDCNKTGISSLVSTTGTLFIDFVWNGVSDGIADNTIFGQDPQYYGTTNISISNYNGNLYGRVSDGLTIVANLNANIVLTAGVRYKIAFAFQNNDIVLFVNGTLRNSATSGTIPATSSVYLNNNHPNNKSVNQALVFKTRLTNAQLAELTTL